MENLREKAKMDIKDEYAHYNLPDWFLQYIVSTVNDLPRKLEIGITLNTGGMIISGMLISVQEYFDNFGNQLSSLFEDEEDKELIKKEYQSLGKIPVEKEEKRMPPCYIHLKNAKFYSSTNKPIPTNTGVLWRGRISRVDAFTLGVLGLGEIPTI